MNKVTKLLDAIVSVIANVRDLADSLQVVADVLTEFKTEFKNMEVIEQQPVGQILDKAPKSNNEKAKVYTLEDVRGVLAQKSQSGLTSEVKCLIAKFGASKLIDIDPSNYEAIIKEAEVLGNK